MQKKKPQLIKSEDAGGPFKVQWMGYSDLWSHFEIPISSAIIKNATV